MIQKLLIANRGEIACRIITTARRIGIATVAVYSDADARAKHVELADAAVHIGPAPAAESYLNTQAILKAAKDSGADAIHPGYGFLSENPDFVDAVTSAGLIFVGPSADAIRAMGLKDAAKALMDQAGVPVVPGYHGATQDPDFLAKQADTIGYPVLIKARAGGGGRGMRLVERADAFQDALSSAMREAENAFGDSAVLIEKYITAPRHIEVQVFGDTHGQVVHLFERDCSLQRRHQKVIEEAPAPGMTPEFRTAITAAAIKAARAINYVNAGTVEFIVDGSNGLHPDKFWFMEMNTRLQVEHPVTEAVTGIDLVDWQLRVASGAPLPLTQDQIKLNGHAFEARIYAEDVPAGFLPATGQITQLESNQAPEFQRAPWRIDSGVRAGDEVSPFYDPMIAKVIAYDDDRTSALQSLNVLMAGCAIGGVTTNLGFLRRLALHAGFGAGDLDTGLIERDLPALTGPSEPSEQVTKAAALAALGLLDEPSHDDPWASLTGWRCFGTASHHLRLMRNGIETQHMVEIRPDGVTIDGDPFKSFAKATPHGTYNLSGETLTVYDDAGDTWIFTLPRSGTAGEDATSGDVIRAPMPGLLKALSVAPGDPVKKGQMLAVLEAMKMEHTLTAPRDGVIASVQAQAGDQVDNAAVLISLETLDDV